MFQYFRYKRIHFSGVFKTDYLWKIRSQVPDLLFYCWFCCLSELALNDVGLKLTCDGCFSQQAAVMDQLVFLSTSEEALEVYKSLTEEMERSGLQRRSSLPAEATHLGSAPLQQV